MVDVRAGVLAATVWPRAAGLEAAVRAVAAEAGVPEMADMRLLDTDGVVERLGRVFVVAALAVVDAGSGRRDVGPGGVLVLDGAELPVPSCFVGDFDGEIVPDRLASALSLLFGSTTGVRPGGAAPIVLGLLLLGALAAPLVAFLLGGSDCPGACSTILPTPASRRNMP